VPDPAQAGADPSTAPPAVDAGAVQQSGGAAGQSPAETGGALPPTGGANQMQDGIPAQGMEAMGREGGRKVVGALHFLRVLFSPFSEEGKAIDSAIRGLAKHFKPDKDTSQSGQIPNLSQIGSPQGQGGQGGPPQLAQQGAQPPTGPIPRLNAGM